MMRIAFCAQTFLVPLSPYLGMADSSLQGRVERLEEGLSEWDALTKNRGSNFKVLLREGLALSQGSKGQN